MRILVTGGHFSPAYSLIKELKKKGYEAAIAGRKHPFEGENGESYEYYVSKEEEIPFFEIRTGRLQRKFTKHTLSSIFKISLGFLDSIRAIKNYKPDIVVTFSGYVGFPVVYVAALFKIPVVLHEQTQNAGLASKLIAPLAKKICISFKSSQEYFMKSKTVLTGNPLREEIFKVDEKIADLPNLPVIYVTGGNTGSHRLNLRISSIIEKLLKDYVVIHQVGDSKVFNDFDKLEINRKSLPKDLQERYILKRFILPSQIGFVFNVTDLVISRSGINIVTELLSLGKTSLLIPLSGAGQFNEQVKNAKLLKEAGIGDYIEEYAISEKSLEHKIRDMIKNKKRFEANSKKASRYVIRDAAKKILSVIEEVYAQKNT